VNQRQLRILEKTLTVPTAPFAEYPAIEYVKAFCAEHKGVTLLPDSAGNLLVRVRKGRRRVARPPCITAHLDHPGFVAHRMVSKGKLLAHWRGGVLVEYFAGERVCFYVGDSKVRGRIISTKTTGSGAGRRVDVATVKVPRDVPAGSIGMWDLPDPRIRGDRIYARACDDMAGVASLLCCVDKLARGKESCDAYFLFTRAEEVGFVGAMAAADTGTIPKQCYVVCTETSSELPHARMGDGPVLRVGDRASTFTSEVTGFCGRVATELGKRSKTFKFQRRLMDGGMCEATAYCMAGCESTCICLSLGNYHNMDKKRTKIAPEYIDLNDFDSLVRWFVALGRTPHRYTGRDEALSKRLDGVRKKYRKLLRSSVGSPG